MEFTRKKRKSKQYATGQYLKHQQNFGDSWGWQGIIENLFQNSPTELTCYTTLQQNPKTSSYGRASMKISLKT